MGTFLDRIKAADLHSDFVADNITGFIEVLQRRERPRDRRAAEQGDEITPSPLIELHTIVHEPGAHGTISNWQGSVSGHSEHNEDFATDQPA